MPDKLPAYADPYLLCGKKGVYAGRVLLAKLPRLLPLLADDEGAADYQLIFDQDADGRCIVSSLVKATLNLVCQRCMHGLAYSVATNTRLCPVSGVQESQQLPDQYEPLLLVDGRFSPLELIEDELILAVPDAPMHAEADCAVDLARLNANRIQDCPPDAKPTERENPFAVLAELKCDAH